ncbi:MAG TPA: translation elongation factor Ts [bacterium]|jgi:elongation factor Ts|nr:translation elongation factor Ts [bacterium]HRS72935.1 translation elongation factor Ts [Patescibacteria group bacterium]HOE81064.1 translation elongation factor Ts [bacterium]HOS99216.1 translation elongation factor Ts [bacterium]HPD03571.1 translation elongation factor Ts [bacterium]
MDINMDTIKKLREQSGAGIIDCKAALLEANGDLNVALEILRKKGIAKAGKRADHAANQGVIKAWVDPEQQWGCLLELRTETDFVARNDKFQQLAEDILEAAVNNKVQDLGSLLALTIHGQIIQEVVENWSGVMGEKIVLSNYATLSSQGTVASYLHGGGTIGVLVAINKPSASELAKDLAMQIAATNPKYLTPEEIPASEIEKEKEIYREQLKQEGKPAEIIDKIIENKLSHYFTEVCLVKQEFIKDEQQTIEKLLAGAIIEGYYRFQL